MKRFLSITLIFVIIFCLLSACTNGDSTKVKTENEKIDLNGAEIKISSWWNMEEKYKGGTPSSDAALERLKAVEQKYNCKIKFVQTTQEEALQKYTSSILSGEPMADIVHLEANWIIPNLVLAGSVLPLDDYFDFSEAKWPKNLKNLAQFNGKMYGVIEKADSTFGLWYNKNLLKELNLQDPYDLYQKGEWTWDNFYKLAKAATRDTNNDGSIDEYGLIGRDSLTQWIYSNDGRIVEEKEGKMSFTMGEPKSIKAVEFYSKLFSDKICPNKGSALFKAGKALFINAELQQGEDYKKSSTFEAGYVMYPKGPDASAHTAVTTNTIIVCFPVNGKNTKAATKIWYELAGWEYIEQEKTEFIEKNVYDSRDVDTALKIMDVMQLDKTKSIPGMDTEVYLPISKELQAGAAATTTVEKYKKIAEQKIDAIMNKN